MVPLSCSFNLARRYLLIRQKIINKTFAWLQAEEQEEGEEEEEEGEEEGEGEVYREREKREGRRKNPERNVRRTSREDCITRIHKGRPADPNHR